MISIVNISQCSRLALNMIYCTDQFEAVAAIPSVVGNAPLATGERKKQ